MEEVRLIKYQESPIRVLVCGEDIKISVADLARSIGLVNGRVTRFNYPAEDVQVKTNGGRQFIRMMSAKDAVSMLFRSRKPGADNVGNWIIETLMRGEYEHVEG